MEGVRIRNFLFFLIIVTMIFCNIPNIIRLNFLGSIMGGKLSVYPLLLGIFIFLCRFYKLGFQVEKKDKYFFCFLLFYVVVILGSLIHGILIYPYFQDVIKGPTEQIEKLPAVYAVLQQYKIPIRKSELFKMWMLIRPIKGAILEILWSFGTSWMIYSWYKRDWGKGVSIMRSGVLICIIIILLYSILDILYLYGLWGSESILKVLNPFIHDIKTNNTWWPPLLWPGQLRSVFAEPSYFGIFAAFAMPWLWFSIYMAESCRKKVILYILFTAYAICLFLTRARTANALFWSEVFLFSVAGVYLRKELFKEVIILVVCAFTALGISSYAITNFLPGSPERAQIIKEQQNGNNSLNISGYLEDNLVSLASSDKRSNKSRYSILKADLAIGLDHPILGVGCGLRDAYIPDYLPEEAFSGKEIQMWIKNQKENGILKSGFPLLGEYSSRLAETGILGLIAYLIPVIVLLHRLLCIIGNKKIVSEDRLPYVFFLISILGVLASGFGDSLNITCAYWILMGIGYAMCFGKRINNIV